jgi:branched-chain amino acid transport system substrate-binding protein
MTARIGSPRRLIAVACLVGALVLGGCTSGPGDAGGELAKIKIGYVTPKTGALAAYGEADSVVIAHMKRFFQTHPVQIGETAYSVDIVVKDSQSDPTRAAMMADELIDTDRVDLILVASTSETTNPVADRCEARSVPCISTVAPWQAFYFARGGRPGSAFAWTYHFFWGFEDVEAVYRDMWSQLDTNQKAAALWPDDPSTTPWRDPVNGVGAAATENGFSIVDPGPYPKDTKDFSSHITRFRTEGADILLGAPAAPEFARFWTQARQQGYVPKIATVSNALLFPSSVEALGDLAVNLGTEVWWSPTHPFKSSLTNQSAALVADTFTADTDGQWTQPVGFAHALFEVAVAALAKAATTDKAAVANALKTLKISTVVGPLDWTAGPVPNVARTPLVGGQWRESSSGSFEFDLVVVSNVNAPDIPTAGTVEPLQ